MADDWIIDVLNDLKAFAEQNGLGATAKKLDGARLEALAELSNASVAKAEMTYRHESQTRKPAHPAARGYLS